MTHFKFKNEEKLSQNELGDLTNLLVPLFSFSYHFRISYEKEGKLYFDTKPKWRLLLYDDNELIGSLSIVERIIKQPALKIAGIGNLGIKQSRQGQGLARDILIKTNDFLREKKFDLSMLFCVERLKPVYEKAGFSQLKSR